MYNVSQSDAFREESPTFHMGFLISRNGNSLKQTALFPSFLFPLHLFPISAGGVYVPCKLDSAYSSPFMAFTWLLLKRANPNSWEKTEQEMALHGGDVWKTTLGLQSCLSYSLGIKKQAWHLPRLIITI